MTASGFAHLLHDCCPRADQPEVQALLRVVPASFIMSQLGPPNQSAELAQYVVKNPGQAALAVAPIARPQWPDVIRKRSKQTVPKEPLHPAHPVFISRVIVRPGDGRK